MVHPTCTHSTKYVIRQDVGMIIFIERDEKTMKHVMIGWEVRLMDSEGAINRKIGWDYYEGSFKIVFLRGL